MPTPWFQAMVVFLTSMLSVTLVVRALTLTTVLTWTSRVNSVELA